MKKKFLGVSYESDDGRWILEQLSLDVDSPNNVQFELQEAEGISVLSLSLNELRQLSNLFSEVLVDLDVNAPIQISNPGSSFVPTVITPAMDMRFHPDPDGVMGL